MTSQAGIPTGAAVAIADLLDSCAQMQMGQEVLILAQVDGLHGGDNLVDEKAIAWIQAGVQARGAKPSVLWIDEPATPHAWRFPPVVKAAMRGCDVLINHSFDLVVEEIAEFRAYIAEHKIWMVRSTSASRPISGSILPPLAFLFRLTQ